jgi:hypothetical protein
VVTSPLEPCGHGEPSPFSIFCEADTVTEETKKARPECADLIPENAVNAII